VLVHSQYGEQLYARELMQSGAGSVGYLLKDRVADVRSFVDAVHRVADGGTVLHPLELMAQSRSNAAIAVASVVTEKAGAGGPALPPGAGLT
jgi:DNA-binding NarL/FixJ family response regulator